MEKKEYLYSYNRYSNGLNRYEVSRQTDHTIWILMRKDYEVNLSKKTMKTGSGYKSTYYYYETQALKEKFTAEDLYQRYHNKLKDLGECKDSTVITQVLAITIP